MNTSLTTLLNGDSLRWQQRLNTFAIQGIQEEDVKHWIWILEAESTDVKVERLVSSDRFKPIFVLMAILRADEHMTKGSTLIKVYDYLAQTYIAQNLEARRALQKELDSSLVGRTLDSQRNMTPDHFTLVIRRLVNHCLKTFPSSLPMIARLVVDYLRVMGDWQPKRGGQRSGYATKCLLFNHTLVNFRRMPPVQPVASMAYNWKAQRILLGHSSGLERPYIITRNSYRAIRVVVMGLKKSKDEQLTASRHTKTWPPYIRQLDGTEEAKNQYDYYSRNVKAGILKQSEGYSHDLVDYALDRVGGALPGQAVSIQTRSPTRALWLSSNSSDAVLAYWATKIRATRDAHEAWQIFNQPPLPGVKGDYQVYAEMFLKLYAKEVDEENLPLPGDGRETFPPYLDNLTEFERARLNPCTPDELYERMIHSGQRPVHMCLSILIRHAPSVEQASRYLDDSGLDKEAVRDLTASASPQYKNLVKIPIPVFDAYLSFLCNQQGKKRWKARGPMLDPRAQQRYFHFNRAIKLISARLGMRRRLAATPWHIVMRTLAHHRLVMRPTVSWAEDDVAALHAMINLFNAYEMSQGLHPVPFDCLCRCILKVLRDKLPSLIAAQDLHDEANTNAIPPHMNRLINDARRHLATAFEMAKSAFAQLTTPVTTPRDTRLSASAADALPPLYHELSASHIRTYLEVLAKFGDVDEGVRVMQWVLTTADAPTGSAILEKARDPAHKQWGMMREAFVCFRAIVETSEGVDREAVAKIEARFAELEANAGEGMDAGAVWSWPTEEDVKEYEQWREERETLPEVF